MTPCPACGATNAASATWCTQCFAAMEESAPTTPAPPSSAPPQPVVDPAAVPAAQVPAGSAAEAAGIRRGADGLEWVCVSCESVNPLEDMRCGVCGQPFTARFAGEAGPEVDWSAARTASLLAPGLGHLRAGDGASGIARLVLFTVWVLGGLGVLVGSRASGILLAAPLLLGAVVIHVLTQRDLAALQARRPQVLEGRVLLWLVVGVTVLVLLGGVVGVGGLFGA